MIVVATFFGVVDLRRSSKAANWVLAVCSLPSRSRTDSGSWGVDHGCSVPETKEATPVDWNGIKLTAIDAAEKSDGIAGLKGSTAVAVCGVPERQVHLASSYEAALSAIATSKIKGVLQFGS